MEKNKNSANFCYNFIFCLFFYFLLHGNSFRHGASCVRRILKRRSGPGTSENLRRTKVGINIVLLQFSPNFCQKFGEGETLPPKKRSSLQFSPILTKKKSFSPIFLGRSQKQTSSPTICVLQRGAFRNYAY